jgi:adenylylsulfate kinase-like enzyme
MLTHMPRLTASTLKGVTQRRHEPVVYLITGPMAAGKSTVARLLAQRFERGVYLQGDHFRRCIVSGAKK